MRCIRRLKPWAVLHASPGVIAIQSLAGAIATGTHGQGLGQGALADDVLHIRMLCADGTVAEFDRAHPWFGAVLLGLGCLGVITEITLRTVPLTVFTCFKSAVSADGLQEQIYTWNNAFTFNKAWWFPEDDRVHVWCSRAATAQEQQLYDAGDGDAVAPHRRRPTRCLAAPRRARRPGSRPICRAYRAALHLSAATPYRQSLVPRRGPLSPAMT